MNFSQRIGITPSTKIIQLKSIDDDLKNRLWNIFKNYVIDALEHYNYNPPFRIFCEALWHHFFKKPIDTIPSNPSNADGHIRKWFFQAEWFEIYNLLEFVTLLDPHSVPINTHAFINACNDILESEFSAYRFINNKLCPITNENEIVEIQEAIEHTNNLSSLKSANIHLTEALTKISDKINPDYRNSIKESISAVESVAKTISKNNNDSLGAALDKIKGKINIHPSQEKGFKLLYAYTSDGAGIRHALKDNITCNSEDAKYMLIVCSAFVNYLIAKSDRAGIILD